MGSPDTDGFGLALAEQDRRDERAARLQAAQRRGEVLGRSILRVFRPQFEAAARACYGVVPYNGVRCPACETYTYTADWVWSPAPGARFPMSPCCGATKRAFRELEPQAAWETLIVRELLPAEWADAPERRFAYDPLRTQHAGTTLGQLQRIARKAPTLGTLFARPDATYQTCAFAALGAAQIATAESFAREAVARLARFGGPRPRTLVWAPIGSSEPRPVLGVRGPDVDRLPDAMRAATDRHGALLFTDSEVFAEYYAFLGQDERNRLHEVLCQDVVLRYAQWNAPDVPNPFAPLVELLRMGLVLEYLSDEHAVIGFPAEGAF